MEWEFMIIKTPTNIIMKKGEHYGILCWKFTYFQKYKCLKCFFTT